MPHKECRWELLCWVKRHANDLCQRRCYETPLQGCVPLNRGKMIRRGHMKWKEEVLGVAGREGWEGFLIVRQSSLVIKLFATRHQWISAIPWIQIAVSQFPFSKGFMCFAYCHIATYHSPTPPPLPCIIHLHCAVLPGGRGHRKITQNRPYKNKFGGGKLKAVNRPWTGREGSKSALNRPWKIYITFPEKRFSKIQYSQIAANKK